MEVTQNEHHHNNKISKNLNPTVIKPAKRICFILHKPRAWTSFRLQQHSLSIFYGDYSLEKGQLLFVKARKRIKPLQDMGMNARVDVPQ